MARVLVVCDLIAGNPYARLFVDSLRDEHEVTCLSEDCEAVPVTGRAQLDAMYGAPRLTVQSAKPPRQSKPSGSRSQIAKYISAANRVRRVYARARRDARALGKLGHFDLVLCINSARLPGCIQHKRKFGGKLVPCMFEIWPNERANYTRQISCAYAAIERKCMQQVDAVIVPHHSWWRMVRLRYGLGNLPCTEIPNVDFHEPVARLDAPEQVRDRALADDTSFYYHGYLGVGRGLELFIEATANVNGMTLHLRGAGKEEQRLRQLTTELGVDDRVSFLDPIPPDQLVDSCRPYDVGVIAFLKDSGNGKFGIGSKLYQYLAAGKPVIAPDSWPLKEIMRAHGVGRTFRAGDSASLLACIREFVEHRERTDQWSRNAAVAAATCFSYQRVCEKVRETVRHMLIAT